MATNIRIGLGYDLHRTEVGRPLVLALSLIHISEPTRPY